MRTTTSHVLPPAYPRALDSASASSAPVRSLSPPPTHRTLAVIPPHLASRLCTGSLSDPQPPGTYTILVRRSWPRGLAETAVQAWWPRLAPSVELLHLCQPDGARLTWEVFTHLYQAELAAVPRQVRLGYLVHLGHLLGRYLTVALLCGERAPGGDERQVRCHRRLLLDWFLGRVGAGDAIFSDTTATGVVDVPMKGEAIHVVA